MKKQEIHSIKSLAPKEQNIFETLEIKLLKDAIKNGAPNRGTDPLQYSSGTITSYAGGRKFEDLPLSSFTLLGISEAQVVALSATQRAILPHSVCGRDILGASKTGSGKTLAFLVTILEKLYRQRWSETDGVGSFVIAPTRELALQIFGEFQNIGSHHKLHVGILVGGRDFLKESCEVCRSSVLICTPGRLLHHMDKTPNFIFSQLQILVLDEADRVLDLGFSKTLNAIIQNLTPTRQTLLFSATNQKNMEKNVRLTLSTPEFISIHAISVSATPLKLHQGYVICELQEKIDVLWAFIKAHLNCKVIVFLATCAQARFLFEVLRKLRPGIPLESLHGKMKQTKRLKGYRRFCESTNMLLIATDIASRGLNFPAVDWVIQLDCPENVEQYIHRVGRTARYTHSGRAMLLLLPVEKDAMLKRFQEQNIPINLKKIQRCKEKSISLVLQGLISKNKDLKNMSERAVESYIKSVYMTKEKGFLASGPSALSIPEYAFSMGLSTVPHLDIISTKGGSYRRST